MHRIFRVAVITIIMSRESLFLSLALLLLLVIVLLLCFSLSLSLDRIGFPRRPFREIAGSTGFPRDTRSSPSPPGRVRAKYRRTIEQRDVESEGSERDSTTCVATTHRKTNISWLRYLRAPILLARMTRGVEPRRRYSSVVSSSSWRRRRRW